MTTSSADSVMHDGVSDGEDVFPPRTFEDDRHRGFLSCLTSKEVLPADLHLVPDTPPPEASSVESEPAHSNSAELGSSQREETEHSNHPELVSSQQEAESQQAPKKFHLHRHGININGRLPIEAPCFYDQRDMEQEATQPATQPYYDPRRAGHSGSLNPEDDADILLFMHPNSVAAHNAVRHCAEYSPQHIRRNGGLTMNTKDQDSQRGSSYDHEVAAKYGKNRRSRAKTGEHDLALRLSSRVHDVCLGYVFGRDPNQCDIILKPGNQAPLRISSMHFRIYVTDDGVIMLEDISTNGTFVDEVLLKCKNPALGMPQRRTLDHGSIISVITWTEKGTLKTESATFIVRIPERDPDALRLYRMNLQRYIDARKDARENAQHNIARVRPRIRKPPNATPEQVIGLGEGLYGVGNARFNHGMSWNGGEKYAVISQIGKGAFATVYKLATRSEGALFAAKEIEKARFARNGHLDTKLNNELEIMKKVNHEHIVKFIDFYDSGTHLYIILEFVGGGDLSGFLSRKGRMEEKIAQSMTRQLCQALSYIHSLNITHRDIKPDNILLASLDPLVVKLSDFGLSKMIEDEGATVLKTFCGTLLYCAPEVYPDFENIRTRKTRGHYRRGAPRGSPRYGCNVDIWSLAAVIFHLLVGEPPYEGKVENNGAGMLQTIMHETVDFSPFLQLAISDNCTDLIRSMLRIYPEDRPSANDCLQHIWIRDMPDVIQSGQEFFEDAQGVTTAAMETTESTTLKATEVTEIEGNGESFAVARKTSRPSSPGPELCAQGVPITIATRTRSRPRLFGEVTSSGVPDSGIFGANQAPLIVVNNNENGQTIGDEARHEEEVSELGSTVSQIQELTVESSGWPSLQFTSTATSGIKRGRDQEGEETSSITGNSKRIMSSNQLNLLSDERTEDRLLGKLSPMPGSIDDKVLLLTDRLAIWGRWPKASHVYPNPMDVRIPKIGMDLVFWCPGMEEALSKGVDWRSLQGSYCLIKTRSSKGIKVNGVPLERDAPAGPFRCGKLMTKDVIEIFDNGKEFLKYECEFFHGESAKERLSGQGFVVEENHELWKAAAARCAELSTLEK